MFTSDDKTEKRKEKEKGNSKFSLKMASSPESFYLNYFECI
jgi:hypothetical protein